MEKLPANRKNCLNRSSLIWFWKISFNIQIESLRSSESDNANKNVLPDSFLVAIRKSSFRIYDSEILFLPYYGEVLRRTSLEKVKIQISKRLKI